MGRCTSLMTRPELQAGVCSSVAPLCGAGSPVAIIYARRYQFLTICSREVCVNLLLRFQPASQSPVPARFFLSDEFV